MSTETLDVATLQACAPRRERRSRLVVMFTQTRLQARRFGANAAGRQTRRVGPLAAKNHRRMDCARLPEGGPLR